MTVRDVKPFVELGVVPYFMDRKLIQQIMIERNCERDQAIKFLTIKWLAEPFQKRRNKNGN